MNLKRYTLLFLVLNFLVMPRAFTMNPYAGSGNDNKILTTSRYTLSYEQIKMAAESGDADAQYALGYMFYYGKGGAAKDPVLAKRWISSAAAQKQPQAMRALALMEAAQRGKPATPSNSDASAKTQMASQENPEWQRVDTNPSVEKTPTIEERHPPAPTNNVIPTNANRFTENKSVVSDNVHHEEVGLYTLQLLGASHRDSIIKLIADHHLQNQAKIYHTSLKNKDWYILTYGKYDTKSEAKQVAKRLATELNIQPWIKPYSSLNNLKLEKD